MAAEQETQQNHVLQENARDYKSIIDSHENTTITIGGSSFHNQTQSMNDEINEPARLVSSTSTEEGSSKLFLTTALSTSAGVSNSHQLAVSTARTPAIFRSTQNYSNGFTAKRFHSLPPAASTNSWRLRNYSDMQPAQSSPFHSTDVYTGPGPTSMILMRDKWKNKSGCFYSCIYQAKGLQTVVSKYDFSTNIQLCEPLKIVSFIFKSSLH